MADDGICGSRAPAIVVRDGRVLLAGTPYAIDEVVAALARGERPPELSDAQIALAEAHYERDAAVLDATQAAAASTTEEASRIASSTVSRPAGSQE